MFREYLLEKANLEVCPKFTSNQLSSLLPLAEDLLRERAAAIKARPRAPSRPEERKIEKL